MSFYFGTQFAAETILDTNKTKTLTQIKGKLEKNSLKTIYRTV